MLAKISYHKDQFKIFCAIILIVVLMFLSNYYIFYNSTRTIYQQEREKNILTVKSMIKTFDESFKEVNRLINSLYAVPYDIYDSSSKDNINYKNAYLFIRETSKLTLQDYIADFIIYSDKSRFAVTMDGTRDFDELITRRLKNVKYAIEYWMNFAATRHFQIVLPAEEYIETNTDLSATKHRYMVIVGNNILNNARFNIAIIIDTDKLLKYINSQSMMNGASFLIMDSEKKVLLSTDNNYIGDIPDSVYLGGNTQMSWIKGQYEYSYTKSEYNGCIYISKMPKGYDSILLMLKINRNLLIITILLSVIFSFFLSIYIYKPIKNIFALIGNKESLQKNGSYNEIYRNIEEIKNENIKIKSQLDFVEEDVRRSIFFKLVDDISSYGKLKNQIDRYFTVIFSSKRYIMVAFHFDYLEGGKRGGMPGIPQVPDDMPAKIQEKLNGRFDSSIVFYMERMLFIALIGINDSIERQDVIGSISTVTRELQEEVGNKLNSVAAVSRFYTKIDECKYALRDIKICLAYRNIKTVQKVIDAEKPDFSCEIYFPPENVEMLSNYILNGNYEESMALVNKVISTNIQNNISYIKFISVISNIFNNIINTMGVYGFDRLEILKLEMQFYEKLEDVGSFEDIREFLRSIIEQIMEKIQLKKQSKLNKDFIMEYIHLHYNDELYLEKMAEITGTSAKYFSNYFKKNFGVNFIEHLNKVRMRHAKELLKNTDIPVSTVGERVGLPLSGTFTSTFKKYCGVSPVEYRRDSKL